MARIPASRGPLGAALALAFALGVASVPATGGASDFIEISHTSKLADSRTMTISGRMTSDGCAYPPEELILPDGWEAIQRREIAYDPVNCRTIVEEGRPDAKAVAMKFEFDRTIGGGGGSSAGQEAASVSESGYYVVWYEDLLEFLVNAVQSNVWWTYTPGGCVTSGNGNGQLEWLGESGWELIEGTYGHSDDRNCTRQRSVTWGNFKNKDFCSPATVKVKYYTVRAKGNNSGNVTGYNNTEVLNPCDPPFHLSKNSLIHKN